MTVNARAPAAIVSALTAMAVSAAFGQTASIPRVLDGAYTEEQAVHGQELYYTHCLSCHGDDMAGRDQAPPLAGPQFSGIWAGASLAALVDRIGTMPPDRPSALSRSEAVDLLSYILWFNGLPIGQAALESQKSVLEQIVFETPAPGQ
jgi:mono/diheme cytochrome c family protein